MSTISTCTFTIGTITNKIALVTETARNLPLVTRTLSTDLDGLPACCELKAQYTVG